MLQDVRYYKAPLEYELAKIPLIGGKLEFIRTSDYTASEKESAMVQLILNDPSLIHLLKPLHDSLKTVYPQEINGDFGIAVEKVEERMKSGWYNTLWIG